MHESFCIGIIGGSGLGERLLADLEPTDVQAHRVDTPFGPPSDAITTARIGGVPVALLSRHGEGHVHHPAAVPYRANIFALKQLGCTHIIASGATGSLREEIEPGNLVICDQLIDRTNGRAKTFFERAAVHVEFAEPFCPVMRRWLMESAQSLDDITVHDRGTYICMEGPSFSTRAESLMHRQWGADIVGMTALPEARLAREAEMAYALIALPTDYDCWRPRDHGRSEQSLLEEIIGNLQRASSAAFNLIKHSLRDIEMIRKSPSIAHEALKLAIWSHKPSIDPTERAKLEPIWGRYFPE